VPSSYSRACPFDVFCLSSTKLAAEPYGTVSAAGFRSLSCVAVVPVYMGDRWTVFFFLFQIIMSGRSFCVLTLEFSSTVLRMIIFPQVMEQSVTETSLDKHPQRIKMQNRDATSFFRSCYSTRGSRIRCQVGSLLSLTYSSFCLL
jgi:hypothetical protein